MKEAQLLQAKAQRQLLAEVLQNRELIRVSFPGPNDSARAVRLLAIERNSLWFDWTGAAEQTAGANHARMQARISFDHSGRCYRFTTSRFAAGFDRRGMSPALRIQLPLRIEQSEHRQPLSRVWLPDREPVPVQFYSTCGLQPVITGRLASIAENAVTAVVKLGNRKAIERGETFWAQFELPACFVLELPLRVRHVRTISGKQAIIGCSLAPGDDGSVYAERYRNIWDHARRRAPRTRSRQRKSSTPRLNECQAST